MLIVLSFSPGVLKELLQVLHNNRCCRLRVRSHCSQQVEEEIGSNRCEIAEIALSCIHKQDIEQDIVVNLISTILWLRIK